MCTGIGLLVAEFNTVLLNWQWEILIFRHLGNQWLGYVEVELGDTPLPFSVTNMALQSLAGKHGRLRKAEGSISFSLWRKGQRPTGQSRWSSAEAKTTHRKLKGATVVPLSTVRVEPAGGRSGSRNPLETKTSSSLVSTKERFRKRKRNN